MLLSSAFIKQKKIICLPAFTMRIGIRPDLPADM